MMTQENTQKVVLITGASSGIGEATARLLAQKGLRVVLGARRTDRLAAIASDIRDKGGVAEYCALDVTNLEDMQASVKFAQDKFGRLDVVVNNAGLMPLSKLEAFKIDEWNRMIDVNIRGVLHGIAAALPIFKQQQSGQFVNLSSTAGHVVYPAAAVYCATKFAVRALSEGLRQESSDIRVTNISPGATQSELASTITDAEAAQWVEGFRETILPAEAIARAIAFAIEQPDDVDVNEIIVRPIGQSG
ncbi:SDR family oxidoreductase [Oculatella sp. LEGE 06141]|uniref:SDR family oxidoreductase n=1 Tax=Oculatella sp. LEGE 06141 TaxID=1828648 RepID=UPI00188268EB|nr:SDR family oxidoreductase [Oculatella sp. LEGE 06141]MBE9178516.1 SDR family oxidoreductase [Oculatella sp. LEGE 06141]